MTRPWHTEELTTVLDFFRTNKTGLSTADATRRLREDGPNALPEGKRDGLPVIFLRQFQSPLIYILLTASAAVFFLGEVADGMIILAVLLFNAVVGTVQEGRAEQTLHALKQYVETAAVVLRDGEEVSVPDNTVVCGDIIVLREGEKIPADARIISASGLKVDESSLTGESAPVMKTPDTLHQKDLPSAEQRNMVFKGTHVMVGAGHAVVVATGVRTVIGAVAESLATIDTEIPLKKNIRYLSRVIVAVVGVVSSILFILGLIRGEKIVTIFATVVSLAVSIIPEGLPIVMTLVLATGVSRMSKRHALIKKLQAVEALGQARIIAVDKTGTITKNELVIREVWTEGMTFLVSGVGYTPEGTIMLDGSIVDAANHPEILLMGKVAALSAGARVSFSETLKSWRVTGDPTEAALQVYGKKVGFKKEDVLHESPLVAEILFDYRLKYHAAVFGEGAKAFLVVSGAPEVVLTLCTTMRRAGRRHLLHHADREELADVLGNLSGRGLRVVGVAMREEYAETLTPAGVHNLTFLGFFGMQDVLRPEVSQSVLRAEMAGIKVVMITGDYKLTARAIAKEAGIWHEGDEIVTGIAIDEMSDDELKVRVAHAAVFARVTPEHKLRIINAYKRRGEIVAMTGDGVNDAPSLVAADLGVAMGGIGTEVAKEAADIVLLDDNFGSIISAVEEGRSIYKTIQKVILYLFSTSLGETFTVTAALVLGYPLPLLAAQIIWLNFVTDGFLDVALAMEPKEDHLLSGSFTQPKAYLVDGLMVRRMLVMATAMAVGALFLFQKYADADLTKAWTVSLTVLAVFQWCNAWNCRSESVSLFRMNAFSNPFLLFATITIIFLQILAVYTPFLQRVLHTVPLSLSEWVWIVLVATSIIWVEEIRKVFHRRHVLAG